MKAKRIKLTQGSPEWLKWRQGRATASASAIIMGCAPDFWAMHTQAQLRGWLAGTWTPPKPTPDAQAMFDKGHRVEAEVRARIQADEFRVFRPNCYELGRYSASLDGVDAAGGEWLEIKAPRDANSKIWRVAGTGRVPDYVYWQLVHQAGILGEGFEQARVIVSLDGEGRTVLFEAPLLRRQWGEKLEPAWAEFLEAKPEESAENVRRNHALRYFRAKEAADLAAAEAKEARAVLIRRGAFKIPGVVRVSAVKNRGRVDWRRLADDAGLDPEAYRKPQYQTIRVSDLRK